MSKSDLSDNKVNKTLEINKKQIEFYQTSSNQRNTNIATEMWKAVRRPYYFLINNAGIWNDIYSKQLLWMGDLKDKKVLDLGCYSGNALSLTVAEKSCEYVGIDLSESAVEMLQQDINNKGIKNANTYAVDLLSPEFDENDFDVCYAQGVLHHFKYFEAMLKVLSSKLSENGIVVTCDPLETSFPAKIVRGLYRPFQLNKEWEWPFDKESFEIINKYFHIEDVQGFMGSSKWALPLVMVNKKAAVELALKLHRKDMTNANNISGDLWGCMQVVLKLRKRIE